MPNSPASSLQTQNANRLSARSRSSIQASTTIIQQNLRTLTTYISENAVLLERVAVHPSTNFPGRQHENVLLQLLRKKPEPSVEELFEKGRAVAAAALSGEEAWKEQRELWGWARKYCDERIGQYAMEETHELYTAEEKAMGVENVRTGLRKDVEEEDEDEEEEAKQAKDTVPEEERRVARLKLMRNGVVGKYELPPNANWQAKGIPGKPGVPVRGR